MTDENDGPKTTARDIADFLPVGTHEVMPGEFSPLGYFLKVCNDCGAHVVDVGQHEVFHRRLRIQLGLI